MEIYSVSKLRTKKNIGDINEYTHVFGIADVPKSKNVKK